MRIEEWGLPKTYCLLKLLIGGWKNTKINNISEIIQGRKSRSLEYIDIFIHLKE